MNLKFINRCSFVYLYNNDSTNRFETLNSIPQLSNLSEKQVAEYDDYSALMDILWSRKQDTSGLDSNKVEQLMDLSTSNTKPGCLARNLLVANGIINYSEPIVLADELKSSEVKPNKHRHISPNNSRLSVFPNPANDYIIVSYNLDGEIGKSSILVSTLDGKPCFSLDITGKINQTIIPLSGLSAGVYFIQLYNNGGIIESAMFVIYK